MLMSNMMASGARTIFFDSFDSYTGNNYTAPPGWGYGGFNCFSTGDRAYDGGRYPVLDGGQDGDQSYIYRTLNLSGARVFSYAVMSGSGNSLFLLGSQQTYVYLGGSSGNITTGYGTAFITSSNTGKQGPFGYWYLNTLVFANPITATSSNLYFYNYNGDDQGIDCVTFTT